MRDEPATKSDLNETEQELIAQIDETRADLQQVEQKLTAQIDETRADLRQVEQKLTAQIDETRADLRQVEQKLTARVDRLTREIVEIRARLDHTLTREEFKEYFDEIIHGQDEIMKIVGRLDQKKTSTDARLDRVEADVKKNKRDIREIKTKLAM